MAGCQAKAGPGGIAENSQTRAQARPVLPPDGTCQPASEKDLIAAHADWSVDPRKRWITLAYGQPGRWQIDLPCPAGDIGSLLSRISTLNEPTILGVDFPLGLPRAYAALQTGFADFPDYLRSLKTSSPFFEVCGTLDAVSVARPFYPARGLRGMTRFAHAQALELPDTAALFRACDRATPSRPAGAPIFWTLGANQSGKAAISAWRDMLVPALVGPNPPALWPFDGYLKDLMAPGRVVIAETYPAEAMRQLGLPMAGSKRKQADRAKLAPGMHAIMASLGATGDVGAGAGFGADAMGEDRFDSVLGLLCVLQVLSGRQPDFVPNDPWIRRWEGWVLGQTALPRPGVPVA